MEGTFELSFSVKNDPSIDILANDGRNDSLANFVALVGALGGEHFWVYLDPIGGILVACFVAVDWFMTGI